MILQKWGWEAEKKVVGNHRWKVRASQQRPIGLAKPSRNPNLVIYDRHGYSRWRRSWLIGGIFDQMWRSIENVQKCVRKLKN